MPPLLYDTLTPRLEVREGALSDAIFAASLDDVVADAGPEVYREPASTPGTRWAPRSCLPVGRLKVQTEGGGMLSRCMSCGRASATPTRQLVPYRPSESTMQLSAMYERARRRWAPGGTEGVRLLAARAQVAVVASASCACARSEKRSTTRAGAASCACTPTATSNTASSAARRGARAEGPRTALTRRAPRPPVRTGTA